MARILIPIKLSNTTERIIKSRPPMADSMICLPALSLSGMPAEVVIKKMP